MIEEESDRSADLALKRYSAILGHFTYESNAYWARSQHFLVAHAALFGFVVTNLPIGVQSPTWARIYTLAAGAICGLVLSYLWHLILNTGSVWIDHWMDLLKSEAQSAFGTDVFSSIKINSRYMSARNISFIVCKLFMALWILTIVLLAVIAIAKWNRMVLL
ncbi:MAG: hypothetical protein C0392_00020 [Syntrophus sp. (in: bacteria)]|nr:hypothetical protein [Syntrophus sp. (in: bacteria)]